MQAILGSRFRLIGLRDIGCYQELPETSATIEGNSLQKALYVFENFGVECLADDSGLEIDALGGAPGVDSAHYAGPERDSCRNIAKVLTELQGKTNRAAQFKAVITLATRQGIHQFTGIVRGEILAAPQGESGFGYDPIFKPEGYDISFAQMSAEQKNSISHRSRALAQLIRFYEG